MAKRSWYVHLSSTTFGPMSDEELARMLTDGKVMITDFSWHEGLENWTRLCECAEFASFLPPQPQVTPPKASSRMPGDAKPQPPEDLYFTDNPPGDSVLAARNVRHAATKSSKSLRVAITATLESSVHGKFNVVNISERGLFVMAPRPLMLGTTLSFSLDSKSFARKLEIEGVVIRHNLPGEASGFAVEFVRLTPDDLKLIRDYLSLPA